MSARDSLAAYLRMMYLTERTPGATISTWSSPWRRDLSIFTSAATGETPTLMFLDDVPVKPDDAGVLAELGIRWEE